MVISAGEGVPQSLVLSQGVPQSLVLSQGYPSPWSFPEGGEYSSQDQDRVATPLAPGTHPPNTTRHEQDTAAGGTSLAVTQEDFLVYFNHVD